jgi:hypothetical protein
VPDRSRSGTPARGSTPQLVITLTVPNTGL